MSKKVLSVGNCSFDESAIGRVVRDHFDAEVTRASGMTDALFKLRDNRFDLVLVNRLLNGDGRDGVDLIRQIKSDPQLAATPVILLSNYPDYQQRAVTHGAEPGFGKSELTQSATLEKLGKFLR
jgi:CheY-like chemotaxis protein